MSGSGDLPDAAIGDLTPCRARVVELMYNSPDMPPRLRQSNLIDAIVSLCKSNESDKRKQWAEFKVDQPKPPMIVESPTRYQSRFRL